MFAQQVHHKLRHCRPSRRRQLTPLRPDQLVVEQTELDHLRQPSSRTAALAGHRRFSDSGGEDSSVHQNQQQRSQAAIASARSTDSADFQVPPSGPVANSPARSVGRWLDQTSRRAIRANVRMSHRPHYTAACRSASSRRPDECEPSSQTRDAMGREPPGAPSHGRCVVAFYNTMRPHTSLGGLTPIVFATRPSQGHNQNRLSP